MGLIARALEAAGIVTTSVSAARDITRAGRLPRAVFVDFPHGHTTGKAGDPELSYAIVSAALACTDSAEPEQVVDLPFHWADTDEWKDSVFLPVTDEATGEQRRVDERTPRLDTPQFQSDADRAAADESHGGLGCRVCIGLDY